MDERSASAATEFYTRAHSDVLALLAALEHERAARRAAEADAARVWDVLDAVMRSAWTADECSIGLLMVTGNPTRPSVREPFAVERARIDRMREAQEAARITLADAPPGVARWQAVVGAARRVVAETRPDAEGLRHEPSREAVDALGEAMRAWEAGA